MTLLAGLTITRKNVITTIFSLLTVASLFCFVLLHDKYNQRYAFFNFESATPAVLAAGHRKPELLQKDLTMLERALIHDYIYWHRLTVTAVKSGELDRGEVRTIIFVGNNGTHGLGDRMRGILFSYLMAVVTNRLLLIDWRFPFPLSESFRPALLSNLTYDPDFFAPAVHPSNGSFVSHAYVRTETFEGVDHFLNQTKSITFLSEPRPHIQKFFKLIRERKDINGAVRLRPVVKALSLPIKAHDLFPLFFKSLFRPSTALRKVISQPVGTHNRFSLSRLLHLKKLPAKLHNINTVGPYISIHVRLGHGVGEFKQRFNFQGRGLSYKDVSLCFAEDAFELAESLSFQKPFKFYVATDTPEFKNIFSDTVKQFQPRAHVMFGSWPVKHVKDFRQDAQVDRNIFYDTLLDLYLLSKAEGIVCGPSGFASLAIWLGGIKNKKTFRVKTCAVRRNATETESSYPFNIKTGLFKEKTSFSPIIQWFPYATTLGCEWKVRALVAA